MTVESDNHHLNDVFFKYLCVCPLDKVQALMNHLIDVFCGQKTSFMIFCDIYTILEWWDLISSSKLFFKAILSENSVAEPNLVPLPPEYQDVVKKVLDIRSSDLIKSLTEKTHAISSGYLNSYDWKVKMTLASDKVAQLNDPRLLLDLDIGSPDIVKLDLNKEELKSLIDAMEKAKPAVLDMVDE